MENSPLVGQYPVPPILSMLSKKLEISSVYETGYELEEPLTKVPNQLAE